MMRWICGRELERRLHHRIEKPGGSFLIVSPLGENPFFSNRSKPNGLFLSATQNDVHPLDVTSRVIDIKHLGFDRPS